MVNDGSMLGAWPFPDARRDAMAKPESLAPLAGKTPVRLWEYHHLDPVEGRTGPAGHRPEGSPFEDFFQGIP